MKRIRHWDECEVSRLYTILAFSLVEVVLAVGVVAFGIIVIFALLPTALVSVQIGEMEEAASDVLMLAATDLRAVSGAGGSQLFELKPFDPSAESKSYYLDASGAKVLTEDEGRFRLVMTPRATDNPDTAIWHLAVEWPPQAVEPDNHVETVVILRR